MDDFLNNLNKRYWHYEEALRSLGDFPLRKNATIKKLSLSRGFIQSGYKEMQDEVMKKLKFEGTLIDYLCFLSTFQNYNKIFDLGMYVGVLYPKNYKKIRLDEEKFYNLMSKLETFNIKNMLRLWKNNPEMVETIFNENVVEFIKLSLNKDFDLFQFLAKLYKIYMVKESNS